MSDRDGKGSAACQPLDARGEPQELRAATPRNDTSRPRQRRGPTGRAGVGTLHHRGAIALGIAGALALAGSARAKADDALPPPPPRLRSTADLDGMYAWLGPSGAAARIDGGWYSSWGGGVQLVRIRERAALGVVGAWLSGIHYAGRDGGRVALEGVVGTRRLLGPMVGVGLGPVVELGLRHHPWPGAQVSAWLFAGISPYVRVGVVSGAGAYVEAGVQVSLPARRW